MAYFPFFVNVSGREGLVVGGGAVALRKVEKLLPYGPALTVMAPAILPELKKMDSITCLEIPFTASALQGKFFVIAATDDLALNRRIAALCQEQGIPVNVVDDKESCSFLFPALVQRGDLSVGITTGGASPSAAVYVKEQVEACLPERFDDILVFLSDARARVKDRVPDARRAQILKLLFARCMEAGRPLTETELDMMLGEVTP